MNTMNNKRIIAVITVAVLLVGMLSGCSKKGVSIDGSKVSIAESKCSIAFDSFTEMTYEAAEEFMNDEQKANFSDLENVSFWEICFSHQGEHDWPTMPLVAGSGFKIDPEFIYYDGKYREKADILGGNIGNSRAYISLKDDEILKTCEFEYKGYSFVYDFENSEWTYFESN